MIFDKEKGLLETKDINFSIDRTTSRKLAVKNHKCITWLISSIALWDQILLRNKIRPKLHHKLFFFLRTEVNYKLLPGFMTDF